MSDERPPQPPRRSLLGATVLAFGPSLTLGAVGAALFVAAPPERTSAWSWPAALATGVALGVALLAAGAALERISPSFRHVSRRTESALRALRLSPATAVALAAATSLGEELLFRGVLLDRFGLLAQALLFGLLHPAGRRGWAYPLFAVATGLALGAAVLLTGRVATAVAAHLLVNGVALWTTRRSSPRRGAARPRA